MLISVRWLVCVTLVTGCDLVFTLEAPRSPGPPIAADRGSASRTVTEIWSLHSIGVPPSDAPGAHRSSGARA
jgi:hypothetical protein